MECHWQQCWEDLGTAENLSQENCLFSNRCQTCE